jgi:hypothetical protein
VLVSAAPFTAEARAAARAAGVRLRGDPGAIGRAA